MAAMTVVEVSLDPPYPVRIGAGVLAGLRNDLEDDSRAALLVDSCLPDLHPTALASLGDLPRLALAGGESTKRFGPLAEVLDFLAAESLDRDSVLVTLGGGTLGDLGGLAASLFKRGIAVVHAPTTLLSQVDAAVGGKTAINLDAGKNLVGTFHQPRAVIADTNLLATLPEAEWRSGLGEVLKTALLAGEEEWAAVESATPGLAAREPGPVEACVVLCVRHKARVVADDPTERGARRSLNLGHTFAHGIEHAAGYGTVPHGVAVALGLRLALRAGSHLGLLETPDLEGRLERMLRALSLPTELDALDLDPERVLDGMDQDKKGAVGSPQFVIPRRPGQVELGVSIPRPELLEILALP